MAGFDYSVGRSHNMLEAERCGMVTIGRWARFHRVSARAAEAVMKPTEAHHTGSGWRGRSRLTFVIDNSYVPTAAQLEAMREIDQSKPKRCDGCVVRFLTFEPIVGNYGRHLGKRPVEHILAEAAVVIDSTGKVLKVNEQSVESRCGLLVLGADGAILARGKVDERFEALSSIVERLQRRSQDKPALAR